MRWCVAAILAVLVTVCTSVQSGDVATGRAPVTLLTRTAILTGPHTRFLAWGPRGEMLWISGTGDFGRPTALRLRSADGRHIRSLAFGTFGTGGITADDRHVVVVESDTRCHGLLRITTQGGASHCFTGLGIGPIMTGNGTLGPFVNARQLVFMRGLSIYGLDPLSGRQRTLGTIRWPRNLPKLRSDTLYRISADSRYLAVNRNNIGTYNPAYDPVLRVYDLNRGRLLNWSTKEFGGGILAWAPDSRTLWWDQSDKVAGNVLNRVDVRTGTVHRIVNLTMSSLDGLAWSPDGHFATFSWVGSGSDVVDADLIFAARGDGTLIHPLDPTRGPTSRTVAQDPIYPAPGETDASWSPSGRLLAFTRFHDRGGPSTIPATYGVWLDRLRLPRR